MPKETHNLIPADILDMAAYAATRLERRKAMTLIKKNRRVHVGPDATAYFESFDTMWHQVHEMLYIEKGGADQIADELTAYNPLIPNGRELVCTLMFEIDDEDRRARFLAGLGGVEETVSLTIGSDKVMGIPETDIDRTTADGKASAIQFVHFPLTDAQAAEFMDLTKDVIFSIDHPSYGHMAKLSKPSQEALSGDLDA